MNIFLKIVTLIAVMYFIIRVLKWELRLIFCEYDDFFKDKYCL